MTQTKTLLVEREQNVCVITLNRPETMNSFDREMKEEFRTALADARDDKETHCLLLTGGGRGFCTGQDLKERGTNPIEGSPDLAASLERDYIPFIRTIVAMDKPVVCAVNGVAAGVGASIALACDIVIAGRSASFVQAFIKIGSGARLRRHLAPAAGHRISAGKGTGSTRRQITGGTGGGMGHDLAVRG